MPRTLDELRPFPLLSEIARAGQWLGADDFPVPDWAPEIESWLAFVDRAGEWPRYRPRLVGSAGQRDQTLAEILAAWFLSTRHGSRITAWEPMGPNGKPGEFAIDLAGCPGTFVEVKCRGWQAGIVRAEGAKSPRLLQPKNKSGVEFRWSDEWRDIRQAVEKAYGKFPRSKPTLLVVRDDLWGAFTEDDPVVKIALFANKMKNAQAGSYLEEDGSFVGGRHENLGALATLLPMAPGNYRFCVYRNPGCLPSVRLPWDALPGARSVTASGLVLP